jgi:hypothetical protein
VKQWDPDGDTADDWLFEYRQWKAAVAAALKAQAAALTAYNASATRTAQLQAWQSQLTAIANDLRSRVAPYAALNQQLAALDQQLADVAGQLADHLGARDTATSRLLAAGPTDRPVVLLPVRVHTAWSGSTLAVRILPGELHVDRHDPRLPAVERTLGAAYWATRSQPGPGQAEQAWSDLARRLTPQRAAWVARATDPSGHAPLERDELDVQVVARLLPDRFAVVLLSHGEPVDVSATGTPAFVSWGRDVPRDVPVPLLATPADRAWTTDLDAAVANGLALRIPLRSGAPAIDELVVVGVRSGSTPDDLAALLQAHVYGAGLEVLPDGTPTNNADAARSARSAEHDREVLGALVGAPVATTLDAGAGGRSLGALLGLTDAQVAALPGAAAPRGAVTAAVGSLVRAAASGTLSRRYGTADLADLTPAGAAPALRVGAQPFGILPALDASAWTPSADAAEQRLTAAVHDLAARHTLPLDVDPATPPPPPPGPRRATRDDDSAIVDVLVEVAAAVGWSSAGGSWTGVDAVVGPATGPQSPAQYLARLAQGDRSTDLLAAARESVLGALAVAAVSTGAGVSAGLSTLAAAATTDADRAALAVALGQQLDVVSHRLDAWVTGAASRRRATGAAGRPVIGAYGYLAQVAPRTVPWTFGHVLAPSLGHAATAAVLRSGYLGQRRTAWAARLAAATAAQDVAGVAAARAGLAALAPLDDATESRLPMAIDLSSRRVRRARAVLADVRQGLPLAAVLGQQFEQGLVAGGLQRYLAAFRKLTRFSAGTELEQLEATRRTAANAVTTAQLRAEQAHAAADAQAGPVADARAAATTAQAALTAAQTAWAPFQVQVDAQSAAAAALAHAQSTLAALLANPPSSTSHTASYEIPVTT